MEVSSWDISDEDSITQFFPVEEPPPPEGLIPEPPETEVDGRARDILTAIADTPHVHPDQDGPRQQ